MHIATLHPKPPYDLNQLLAILDRFAHPALNISHAGAYWRVVQHDGDMALVRVVQRGTPDAPTLDVHLMASGVDSEPLIPMLQHVLDVDGERGAFFDFAQGQPELWRVVEPLVGLPNTRTASVFEALMLVIIEQQIAWVSAQRGQRWLVEWGGNSITHKGMTFYAFPSPQQIAAATLDELKPLKITHRRITMMIDLAGAIVSGDLDIERLTDEPPQKAYADLLSIKGIGRWTAAVILSRALGHFQYVTDNDVALQAAVNHYFYGEEGRLDASILMDTLARYGDHAGLAGHYTLLRWVLDRYPIVS